MTRLDRLVVFAMYVLLVLLALSCAWLLALGETYQF